MSKLLQALRELESRREAVPAEAAPSLDLMEDPFLDPQPQPGENEPRDDDDFLISSDLCAPCICVATGAVADQDADTELEPPPQARAATKKKRQRKRAKLVSTEPIATVAALPALAEPAEAKPDAAACGKPAIIPEMPAPPAPRRLEAAALLASIRGALAAEPLAGEYAALAAALGELLPAGAPGALAFAAPAWEPHTAEALSHLAVYLAERTGQTVLLVAGAGAASTLGTAWKIERERGLAEILAEETPWNEAVFSAVGERLHLLSAGRRAIELTAPLAQRGRQLAALVEAWKNRYDWVLIDAGEPAARLCSAWSIAADAAVLVVRLGRVTREDAFLALEQLWKQGARVMGTIVTNAEKN